MGLLDFPTPVFAWVDSTLLGELPALARLALWAFVISALSMVLYVLLSPQTELRRLKTEIRTARGALSTYDGEFAGVRALAAHNIGLSLRHLRLVAPAALAACIPVVMLIVWLAGAYGTAPTESGLPLSMTTTGGPAKMLISEGDNSPREPVDQSAPATLRLHVLDETGVELAQARLTPALQRLEKRRWWHWLTSNQVGYLPPDAPVEAVHVRWPRREMFNIGPDWLRGWETPFLALAVIFTLGIQAAFRIE